jgi:hypothetical protein
MALIDLNIPAGVYRNGTDLQSQGRWRDASLVRWHDGIMRPIGGWRTRSDTAGDAKLRGMLTWADNSADRWIATGSYEHLYAYNASGTRYDITPVPFTTGREDAVSFTGFGGGIYGKYAWGVARPDTATVLPATAWQLDTWGENLVAMTEDDGKIYEWDLDITFGSELVTNGTFASDANWTKGVNWTISGGVAEYQQLKKTFDADDATNTDVSTDTITITAHGFSTGDEVTYTVPAAPATALGGLTTATNYFIVGATTNTIQLAATSGGAAINLTRNALTFDGDDATVIDVSTDKIVDTNTFTTGDYVTYSNGGGVDIGGLTNNANYYIIAASASEFQLSLTSGGAAIDLTANNSVTIDSTDVAVVDATNDKIIIANTFSDDEIVTYSNGGGTDIAGLTDGTDYYIINSSATEFQLSATQGGSAIDITGVGVGAAHVFRQDIGSTHSFTVDHGANHELARVNFGNLDQTVSGLANSDETEDTHDIIVTLIDPNDDSDAATVPDVNVKVTGTTSTTVLVNQALSVGENRFRFDTDDTEVKIEIIPNAYNTPNFDVDGISLKNVPTAKLLSNAPVNNESLVVTSERFLFALGAGGNPRKVAFSDRENNNLWTPAVTNEAGDIELNTSGSIMKGLRVRGQTLILTTRDAHSATYIGPPYVYGFERVGTSCGLAAREAAVVVDAGAFWMGANSFYTYNGSAVAELPCDVSDYVFNDINQAQISKAFGMSNSMFGEIWWFYPSAGNTENDRYVVFNYVEGTWYIGQLDRTAGTDRGVYRQPMMAKASDKKIYEHEVGLEYDSLTPFAESGPFRIGTGDQVMSVTEMIPDEKTQGDVNATFKTRFYPNDTERSYGPFTMSNPTSMRFTGRQVRLRVEGAQYTDWRVGINRLDVVGGGRR